MLTGSQSEIRHLWKFFGVDYKRVSQQRPPDRDRWTGKPETFDVEHSDGFFILDPRGHLRVFTFGMPSVGGRLPRPLRHPLNERGDHNLRHPDRPWTARQALQDLLYIRQRDDASAATPPRAAQPSPAAVHAELVAALHAQTDALGSCSNVLAETATRSGSRGCHRSSNCSRTMWELMVSRIVLACSSGNTRRSYSTARSPPALPP